jgi:hypothetical protein
MQTTTLTAEDHDIMVRRTCNVPLYAMHDADSLDYRAMLARVRNVRETIARGESYGYDSDVIGDVLVSEPARIVRAEMSFETPFREMVEQRDGRALS